MNRTDASDEQTKCDEQNTYATPKVELSREKKKVEPTLPVDTLGTRGRS